MNGITEAFSKFGPARLAAMLAVTLALVGFFAFMIIRATTPAMAVLYSDLPLSEAASIIKELDTRGIKYETRQDGQTILAPKADIPRIRMDFAAKGMPSGGSVGYEIFDKGDAFSSTSFVQNINHLRALEGELARTIASISRVTSARVHLVLPERRVFERDREPPRASIVLKVRGELDAAQVRAIRHLAASAVEGLKPERVSIVDETGRLLADGAAEGNAGAAAEEKQSALERRLRAQIEDIVANVVGQGRARVQVAAEMDFSRIQQTQESYDPESRVLRSTQTRTEQTQTTNGENQVSVGNELPGQQRNGPAQNTTRDGSNKNEEIANYDYTKTVRSEMQEGGRVKKISVAVLVDGQYLRNGGGGELAYQPRPQEELDRIGALVRSAIGFDRNRGDTVEIVNLRFAEPPRQAEPLEEPSLLRSLLQPTKDDIYRGAELGVLAILTLIVMLLVVRPLVNRVITPDSLRATFAQVTGGMLSGPTEAVATAGGEGPTVSAAGEPLQPRESAAMRYLDMAKVNGQVQAQSLERIGEVVKANPTEALAIIRQMIHEGR
ncbi:flagellar basal-body MS-ring/collar protein FliF [Terrirubrum flagellatum]|uniref:flagellar basal-body MS-ring/collar protein FliF n=1 Tax=Terrirubrum flagellatum TaxID=2895980 RepID=UPI003CC81A00